MTITYIHTKHQKNNILTKALQRDKFEILRKQLTVWLITLSENDYTFLNNSHKPRKQQ